MDAFDFKIIKKVKTDNIEFYMNRSIEPNNSYEIENCIKKTIKPSELHYEFDFWFDDNDSGYFIKDNIKVEITYGVMDDFTFTTSSNLNENELEKVEFWITKIMTCILNQKTNNNQKTQS